MNKKIVIFSCFFILMGCAYKIDYAIKKHNEVFDTMKLGDSKEYVLSILEPIQNSLPTPARKSPERFIHNGKEVFVYYARSARQPDGLTTDDEFTPYVFQDGKLIAIGWTALGGPKSHGQMTSDTYINIQQSTNVK